MAQLLQRAQAASLDALADSTRASYRKAFSLAVAEGRKLPFVLPYGLFGPFIVPTLWLTVPHRRHPWVYQTRWLVMAFVVILDLDLIFRTSSANIACAFGVGLMAAWAILVSANLLVWSRPQFDAARVMRHRRQPAETRDPDDISSRQDGLRLRRPAGPPHLSTEASVGHIWQPFPEDAPFLDRLWWAIDLTLSFRFSGWNWSVSALPRPAIPSTIRPDTSVDLERMPVISPHGYRRCLTPPCFYRSRLQTFGVNYLALDFLATFMMKDPYFILGPDHPYHLPAHLRDLHPWFLLAYRQLFGLAGVYSAISAMFALHDLGQYMLLQRVCPARGELWMYPSTFGSISQVLDCGLAGWWAACWHQTFRAQFMAPAVYLTRRGALRRGTVPATLVTLFISFLASGLMHASGSRSSIPQTKLWRSPVFFILQAVGITMQQALVSALTRPLPNAPRWLRRGANLAYTVLWLHLTANFFVDDLSASQAWLLEPVPISPLRFFGFGRPDDNWCRWDRAFFPRWYVGDRWWQSGIAL